MDIQDLLRLNYERLLAAYRENVDLVHVLQTTLIGDILPSIVDEFELSPEATNWAKSWLNDTGTLHFSSHHKSFQLITRFTFLPLVASIFRIARVSFF